MQIIDAIHNLCQQFSFGHVSPPAPPTHKVPIPSPPYPSTCVADPVSLLECSAFCHDGLLPLRAFLMQAKTVGGQEQFQGAVKRSAGKGNNQQRKKRKVNETAAPGTDSGSQPEAVAAADTETAAAADRKAGQLLEDLPMRWGGRQKRKHVRLGLADGPNQTRHAPQQKLLTPYFSPAVAHPSGQSAAASGADSAAAALGVQRDKAR